MAASSTNTRSSTYFSVRARVRSLTERGAKVSAIVVVFASWTTWPALIAACIEGAPVGSTPIIFTSGRNCLIAEDIPAIRPPPPMAINTQSTSGRSSNSSSPSVAVPWIVRSASKGCTYTMPSASPCSLARCSASFGLSPCRITVVPQALIRATRSALAVVGR